MPIEYKLFIIYACVCVFYYVSASLITISIILFSCFVFAHENKIKKKKNAERGK